MSENMSLLDFLRELLTNVQLRDYFAADPQAALNEYGLGDLDAHDVQDALVLIGEEHQQADFSRHYDTGNNHIDGGHVKVPEPHGGHEDAATYINRYITNNYVDDRDTIVDNSIHQQIDTHGGDFDQDIDIHSVTASGDGAVAAGGDINNSKIVTGHDNQVGDGNIRGDGNVVGDGNHAVTGDHDTTAFGNGNATSTNVHGDVNVGDGAAFASGGSAAVDNSDRSLHNVGNDYSDRSVNDSFKDSSDNSVHDSGNTSLDASTHDSHNDNSQSEIEDSFNNSSHHTHEIDHSVSHSFNVDLPV